MAYKSMAEILSETDVMINGIRQHQDVLAKRQIDNQFADDLQVEVDNCFTLNNEQETLKAKLKEKTEELDNAFAAVQKKAGEARKIIKLDMPQATWREFGITDKR
jgi:hypothetical protein